MNRRVLYELRSLQFPGEPTEKANLNDLIELDPFLDYTLEQHIEDLATKGITLVSVIGSIHLFSDGTTRVFEEAEEPVPLDRLDVATYLLLAGALFTRDGLPDEAAPPRCLEGL